MGLLTRRTRQIAQCSLFACVITIAHVAVASDALPIRSAERPQTTNGVPHVQLDVVTNAEVEVLVERIVDAVDKLEGVKVRPTMISLPGARGFWLSDNVSLANPQAIVGGREFAHMHPDGSLHAALSPTLAEQAVEAGWAIYHPWSKQRLGWEGFVMIYTPQSDQQADVVYRLIVESYNYVTGKNAPVEVKL